MKKLFVIGSLLSVMSLFSQQKNVFWDRNFWNEHTTIAQVVTEIKNGNSPSELNEAAFDAPSLAILGKVPTPTAIYLIEQQGNGVQDYS